MLVVEEPRRQSSSPPAGDDPSCGIGSGCYVWGQAVVQVDAVGSLDGLLTVRLCAGPLQRGIPPTILPG